MQLYNLVVEALKEKAPDLHKKLSAAGTLREFARDLAAEISSQVVTLTQEQRQRENWDKLGPMECAARMRAADLSNLEVVLADLLEFPQDETSPQSPDETTDSVPTT